MTLLTVRVLGVFAVRPADGPAQHGAEVGSRKARTLLAVLAVSPGHTTTDRIATALWDDTPPRDPTANVATLVSRLRARFGAPAVEKVGAGYRLGVDVRVDLRDTAELVADAESMVGRGEPFLARAAASRAARLLSHGEVLAEAPDAAWAEPARAWRRGLLRRARHTIAQAALGVGDLETARTAASNAVDNDAFDETACRLLMRAHHQAGEPAQALRVYERLRTNLAAELGIDPSAPTRELHLAILRDAAVSTP